MGTGTQDQYTAVQAVIAGANVNIGGTPSSPVINAVQSDPLVPTGFWYEPFSRFPGVSQDVGSLTSKVMTMLACEILAGEVLNTITFYTGVTAMITGVNQWFCLLDANFNALAATKDDGATGWAANSPKTLTVDFLYVAGAWTGVSGTPQPYSFTTTGVYYIGIMVNATTVPSMRGSSADAHFAEIAPVFTATSVVLAGAQLVPNTSNAAYVNQGAPTGFPYFNLG